MPDTIERLMPNPARRVQEITIGNEQNPALIIDDILLSPSEIVQFANRSCFQPVTKDLYPGIRAMVDPLCFKDVIDALENKLRQTFTLLNAGSPKPAFTAFSLATMTADTALPIQRIPHFDTSDNNQLALIIYLSQHDHGGTAFYRHTATGFESITNERSPQYARTLKQEAYKHGLPDKSYITDSTTMFTRTLQVDYRFNRAVIYRSNLLHSGQLKGSLSADPMQGRLTANAFIRF